MKISSKSTKFTIFGMSLLGLLVALSVGGQPGCTFDCWEGTWEGGAHNTCFLNGSPVSCIECFLNCGGGGGGDNCDIPGPTCDPFAE